MSGTKIWFIVWPDGKVFEKTQTSVSKAHAVGAAIRTWLIPSYFPDLDLGGALTWVQSGKGLAVGRLSTRGMRVASLMTPARRPAPPLAEGDRRSPMGPTTIQTTHPRPADRS